MDGVKRVLALAPHTDDVELGAGGAVARWIEEGAQVFYVAFSIAERSVLPEFPCNILESEVQESTRVLGIPRENLFIHKFDVRRFPEVRQEILELMIRLRHDLSPDLVLMPTRKDVHQDHHVIAQEGLRSFRQCSILAYELPWNAASLEAGCFVGLEERHLEAKMSALGKYASQRHRPYMDDEFLRGLARVRGLQMGAKYAEAFEVVRWILR